MSESELPTTFSFKLMYWTGSLIERACLSVVRCSWVRRAALRAWTLFKALLRLVVRFEVWAALRRGDHGHARAVQCIARDLHLSE